MRTLAHPRTLARRPLRALLAQWPLAVAGDVEGIHQTRVASRRLREVVPAVARAADASQARALRRRLREVTRALGRSRELDVALETLRGVEARSSRRAVAAIRAHVLRERAAARRDARARLAAVDVETFAAVTVALAGRSESPEAIRACARRVAARLGRRAGELRSSVVGAGLIFAPGPLHAVRIALKKFRYTLEVAERMGRFRLTATMLALKRLQDLLGDLHDLQVLSSLARDVTAQAPASRRAALESLVNALDEAVRALHSQFVNQRETIVALLARSTRVRRSLIALPPPGQPTPVGRFARRSAARRGPRARTPENS